VAERGQDLFMRKKQIPQKLTSEAGEGDARPSEADN
jgi:hypothetical protein